MHAQINERDEYWPDDVAALSALKESGYDPGEFAEVEREVLASVGYCVISHTNAVSHTQAAAQPAVPTREQSYGANSLKAALPDLAD